MPKLSVFIPNFNDSATLPKALDALLSQSRQPDEIVVLDDGSTDESLEILADYEKRVPRLTVKRNLQNEGLERVIERIPDLVTGDYVYCGSANDSVLPEFFKAAVENLDRFPDAGFVFGQLLFVDQNGIETLKPAPWGESRYLSGREFQKHFLSRIKPWESWSTATIYRTEALRAVGGFRGRMLQSWCDTAVIYVAGSIYGAVHIPTPVARFVATKSGFAASRMGDREKALSIIAGARKLMLSEEFPNLFDPDFVERWYRKYRFVIQFRRLARLKNYLNRCREVVSRRWKLSTAGSQQ